MMDSITVGAKIRMTEAVTGDYPVGSTATILYIDEMDNVFIEWTDGKLSSFSDKQVLKGFEKQEHKKAQMAKIGHLRFCYMISKWFFLHRISPSLCILLNSFDSTERSTLR